MAAMTTLPIPLVAPCVTNQDREYMSSSLALGVLTTEREVAKYEAMFAERVNAAWAVAVNSGTSALAVALTAYGIEREEVLLIPSWSCIALRNAVEAAGGGDPDLMDTSWNVRYALALTYNHAPDVPSVIAHMFGNPTVMTTEPIIEDWTLSLGGVDRLTARLGVCSTHASKMISTGRGGIIFGDDEDLHERVRNLVHYDTHTDFGYSFAMSSMQAALGVSQLRQLNTFIARRQELAARYTDAFRPAGIGCPDADCGSVFFRYLIWSNNPAQAVLELAEHGIEAGRGINPPLHQLAELPDTQFPGTTRAVNTLLSVPVHPSITDQQADHIIRAVLEVCAP